MSDHPHHHHEHHHAKPGIPISNFKLSVQATMHCLLGCGIGEVAGMIISTALSLSILSSTVLSVLLGFIAGLALGILPLIRANFSVTNALRTVILAEGLSIAVMEAFEVLTQMAIPGVMTAHLTDMLFWAGMLASLIIGFVAALPVNFIMIRKGVRHQH
jgi:hypothetical protein